MSLAPQIGETAIWERIFQLGVSNLSPEAAKYFLDLSFASADLERMHTLTTKQQLVELSRDELVELQAYRKIGLQLDLQRSKARRVVGIQPKRADVH